MTRRCALIFILSFLFGCSSTPSQKDAMGNCQNGVQAAFSAGDTIRYDFPIQKQSEVEVLAKNWCDVRGKNVKKSTQSCSGCCTATFRCTQN